MYLTTIISKYRYMQLKIATNISEYLNLKNIYIKLPSAIPFFQSCCSKRRTVVKMFFSGPPLYVQKNKQKRNLTINIQGSSNYLILFKTFLQNIYFVCLFVCFIIFLRVRLLGVCFVMERGEGDLGY